MQFDSAVCWREREMKEREKKVPALLRPTSLLRHHTSLHFSSHTSSSSSFAHFSIRVVLSSSLSLTPHPMRCDACLAPSLGWGNRSWRYCRHVPQSGGQWRALFIFVVPCSEKVLLGEMDVVEEKRRSLTWACTPNWGGHAVGSELVTMSKGSRLSRARRAMWSGSKLTKVGVAVGGLVWGVWLKALAELIDLERLAGGGWAGRLKYSEVHGELIQEGCEVQQQETRYRERQRKQRERERSPFCFSVCTDDWHLYVTCTWSVLHCDFNTTYKENYSSKSC